MNSQFHKVIFSQRLGSLVAVGEHASAQGKSARGEGARGAALAAAVFLASLTSAYALDPSALPSGPTAVAGAAAIAVNGARMDITQSSDRAAINWQSFNIGTGASLHIAQPSASAVLLNRVVGNEMSQIRGQINANGQVVLVNPNGIVMGPTGRITASAFTASSFDISDADFQAGQMRFQRSATSGAVVNQGSIESTDAGGYVALIGADVNNQGTITTRQGAVVLAAADAVVMPNTPGFDTQKISVPLSRNVRLELNPAAFGPASVSNSGVIVTDGGQVLMRAAAVVDAVSKIANARVTHNGTIHSGGGRVDVLSDQGTVRVSGAVNASGGSVFIGRDEQTNTLAAVGDVRGAQLESQGGFVETSGHYLATHGVSVKAKDWLLDPNDIRIVATDTATTDTRVVTAAGTSTFQDNTGILASEVLKSTIESAINAGTNVTISTANPTAGADGSGNITIETALSFNNTGAQAATLRLFAVNGITQNTGATISATGSQLVHIDMAAEGRYMGNTSASANSLGITLNEVITTNGDVTLSGQARHTVANQGVGVNGLSGSDITARNISITGNSATSFDIQYQGGLTTTGGGNVTLTGNGLSLSGNPISAGAGTVTIQNRTAGTLIDVGGTSSDVVSGTLKLGISSVELGLITASTIVVGRRDATASGNVAINALNMGAMGNTGGSLSVLSDGNIAVNDSITKTAGTDATLTLLANGNITLATNKTITASTGKLNVLLNSDSDASGAGSVVFNTGSGVTSNGGNITLGGGSALDGSGTAVGDGVSSYAGITLATAVLNAGGGNITMTGTTFRNAATNTSNVHGILITNGSINTTGAGTIALKGYSNTITDTLSKAIQISGTTITGGSTGTLSLIGDSRSANAVGSYLYGVALGTNAVVTSLGGNIEVTGYGGNGSGGFAANIGVAITGGAKVAGVGAGTVTLSGTGGQGNAGTNIGFYTNGGSTAVSSQGADINVTGQGGNGSNSEGILIGGGALGVATGTTSANVILTSDSTKIQTATINSGTGTTTIQNRTAGTLINVGGADVLNTTPLTLGITNAEMNLISAGTLKIGSTTSGAMTTSAAVTTAASTGHVFLQSGSSLAVSHAIVSGAGLYLQTTGGALSNSAALSGTNVSLDNSNGSINLVTGAITSGTGITAASDGITVSGSLTATNNLNVYGASGNANGINTSANWSGQYINAIGTTTTGYTGFSWNGGTINTTGTGGASATSTVKGLSGASTTASNGFGALMMFANGTANAAAGTTLTLAGEATTLTTGQNIKQRGILVQGGRTLTMSGDVTLDGSSKSSEGISFGGTVNMTTVAGVTNKLTLKGTAAASSNSSLNAVNMSGVINSNASTSSINFIGDAKNLSGTSWDRGVNISGAINGGTANVNIQSTGANITTSAAIAGANISIDNTNGTINATSGAITVGSAGAGSAVGISVGGNITATDNLNMWGASTNNTGINVLASKSLSGGNIQATGRVNNGGYGLLLNAGSSVITTGTSGDSLVKGINTNGGSNAVLTGGTPTLTAATGTTLTVWGDGTNTGDRAMRVDGGATTNGAVTIKGTSNNATSLMLINGAVTANANSALTLSGSTSASNQSAVYFVNNGGVALKNGATVSITGQNTTSSGAGTGVLIQGGGIYKAAGATSAGAVSITGSVSSGTTGSTGVSVQVGVSTVGNIDIQGNVASAASTGVSITNAGGIASSGTNSTININSNFSITHAGYMNVSGATGTGSNINLTSTNNSISGAGTIGDTTNKNASVTFTQAGTSTFSGAINAANFTKAGAGALTLDSWLATTPVNTNISNAYTVSSGTLSLSPHANYATIQPASVNVVNNATFSLSNAGNGFWRNTAFNFTGGQGGGTMNLLGNPIGASSTTNTFSTSGGATNTINGLLNANNANVDLNLAAATSGTTLLDGSYAALVFAQNAQGGFGLDNATTINTNGPGGLLFLNKVKATQLNINSGTVQFGNGSAATAAATPELQATNVAIASGAHLILNRAEAQTNASVFTGAGSLTQAGAGTLTLTGNSSAFAGSTTVNAGRTLAIGTNGNFGAAGSTLNLASATSSVGFTNASGTSTIGSTIGGAGTLSKSDWGTGVLTADNTYLGTTTVSRGTLQVGNGDSTGTLGAGAVTLSNNADLHYVRSATTNIFNTISGAGNLSATITGASSDLSVTGEVSLWASALPWVSQGRINLSTDANLTVSQNLSTTNHDSDAIVLIAGAATHAGTSTGGDIRFTGSGAVNVGSGGRATLFTGSVAGSTGLGISAGNSRFNSDESVENFTRALGDGKQVIYREAYALNGSIADATKIYDGQTHGNAYTYSINNGVNGDTNAHINASAFSGDAVTAVNVGTYSITASGLTSDLGYIVNDLSGQLTITPQDVTLQAVTVDNKSYDGTTQATIASSTLTGTVGSETLNVTGTANFIDANVGNAIRVDVNDLQLANGTGLASNYRLVTTSADTSAHISRRDIGLVSLTADDKTFDGTTAASITGASFSNLVAGQTLGLSGVGEFSDAAIGDNKTVNVATLSALTQTNGTGRWQNYNLTTSGSFTTLASIQAAAPTPGPGPDSEGAIPDWPKVERLNRRPADHLLAQPSNSSAYALAQEDPDSKTIMVRGCGAGQEPEWRDSCLPISPSYTARYN